MASNRHPPPERLERYLRGMVKGAARDALERHFMACDACSERLRLELGVELVGAAPKGPERRPAREGD